LHLPFWIAHRFLSQEACSAQRVRPNAQETDAEPPAAKPGCGANCCAGAVNPLWHTSLKDWQQGRAEFGARQEASQAHTAVIELTPEAMPMPQLLGRQVGKAEAAGSMAFAAGKKVFAVAGIMGFAAGNTAGRVDAVRPNAPTLLVALREAPKACTGAGGATGLGVGDSR